MFDLGWSELLVIGVTALIVVGPKDLPVLFRNVGRFVGRMKGMAREFSKAMNDAAEGSGVNDMAKTFKTATNPVSSAMDGVKDAAKDLTNWKPDASATKKKTEPKAPDPEREAQRKKIELATAKKAAERKAREAEEAAAKVAEMEAGQSATPAAAAPKDSK